MAKARVVPEGPVDDKRTTVAQTIRDRVDHLVSAMNYAKTLGMDVSFSINLDADGLFQPTVNISHTVKF